MAEIVKLCSNVRRIFDRHGLKGCGGEHGPTEPLAFFAAVHQVNVDELLQEIRAELEIPSPERYAYEETLQDHIYRRFFKAGVAIAGKSWKLVGTLSSMHADAARLGKRRLQSFRHRVERFYLPIHALFNPPNRQTRG